MIRTPFCGGCYPEGPRHECIGSFLRRGIKKVHWECWSDCNLSCQFCYRTKAETLTTEGGFRLIDAVSTAGAKGIVFAGGDPSIRPDINDLILYASKASLWVEVQTNAHRVREQFRESLKLAQMVGLSLDAETPDDHNSFRNKPGNFQRVLELLMWLRAENIPTIVRTIVAKQNFDRIAGLGPILSDFPNVVRWSLLEFSPIGNGYRNQSAYSISRSLYEQTVQACAEGYAFPERLDVYRVESKVGSYALMTPNGQLYGTTTAAVDGLYPIVGSILTTHLSECADRLPFAEEQHHRRYGAFFDVPAE